MQLSPDDREAAIEALDAILDDVDVPDGDGGADRLGSLVNTAQLARQVMNTLDPPLWPTQLRLIPGGA